MNARQRRQYFVKAWDPVRILPMFIDDAAAQLREAGLPATIEELRAREKRPGTTGTRSTYERIKQARSVSTVLRDYASMIWHGDELLRQCQRRGNRELLALATCFFVNQYSAFGVETLPLRKAAANSRGGRAKARQSRQEKTQQNVARYWDVYKSIKATNPRLTHNAIKLKVSERCGVSMRTLDRRLKHPNPRRRRE